MTSLEDAAHIIGEQREVIKAQAEMMRKMHRSLSDTLAILEGPTPPSAKMFSVMNSARQALTAYEKAKHNG